jgi:GntR family transcriptional regulator
VPPKYQEIAAALRAEIVDGEHAPGARLPSEPQLVERFGAAQGTIRRALAVLQAEGLIEARHGAGVFVRSFRPILRRTGHGPRSTIWSTELESRQLDVDSVRVYLAPAPERIEAVLDRTDMWIRERRYLVAGRPVMLAKSYVPCWLLPDGLVDEVAADDGGTYMSLLDQGYKIARFRDDLRARVASVDEVKALDLRPGTPVVEIARTAFTGDGRPVDVTVMVLDALAYVLQYDFTS